MGFLNILPMICSRLVLLDCHWVTRHSVENLSKNLVGLKTINLTGCWELVDQTMLQMLSKFAR